MPQGLESRKADRRRVLNQTQHKPATDGQQIAPKGDLQRALGERMRDPRAEARGEQAGRHHQHRADQRDVAKRERRSRLRLELLGGE